jgi:hypothetical protein
MDIKNRKRPSRNQNWHIRVRFFQFSSSKNIQQTLLEEIRRENSSKNVKRFHLYESAKIHRKFRDLRGLLVTLDDIGNLSVTYLGTDPSESVVKVERDSAPFNYEETDNELRRLQAKIAEVTEGKPIIHKF